VPTFGSQLMRINFKNSFLSCFLTCITCYSLS